MINDRWKPVAFVAAAALIGIGTMIGWLARDARVQPLSADAAGQVRADLSEYKYVNPLLFSNTPRSDDPYFASLASKLRADVDAAARDGAALAVSVYFRDVNTGHWTGVNEDDLYTPSSMMKVIALMAALKLAQTDPSLLAKKLELHRTPNGAELYTPDDDLASGPYPVEKLIEVMVRNSDNDAFDALVSDREVNMEFVRLYDLFRLPSAGISGGGGDFMSPKSYSAIYRVLYNSTLLEWGLSEQVLGLLTKTTFTAGLVAGVPSSVPVAHKFGINTDELHDCGIVYYPDAPYLLCVMTRGRSLTSLESTIAGISRDVYSYVSSSR